LLAAGFYVAKGAATGAKTETTIALTPAAALHHGSRGRRLLGGEWLDRWRRSDARYPTDVATEAREGFSERIVNHPQFQPETT
jgi:queuine tRNA-ribosyltransferase